MLIGLQPAFPSTRGKRSFSDSQMGSCLRIPREVKSGNDFPKRMSLVQRLLSGH